MDKFSSLIDKKRVAIVGPSPHLLGSNMGKKIDSYDIVCRLNEVRPKGLEADYGSKADILFWHLNNCDMEEFDTFRRADHFDTFKGTITVHKEPKRTVTLSSDQNIYAGSGS